MKELTEKDRTPQKDSIHVRNSGIGVAYFDVDPKEVVPPVADFSQIPYPPAKEYSKAMDGARKIEDSVMGVAVFGRKKLDDNK